MTSEEKRVTELAAAHAERVAGRMESKGDAGTGTMLRMFAGSLRAGSHMRPPGDEDEAAARQVATVQDLIRQKG
jgi:hypothetical protein